MRWKVGKRREGELKEERRMDGDISVVKEDSGIPLNVLYSLADVNPANAPMRTNSSNIPVERREE